MSMDQSKRRSHVLHKCAADCAGCMYCRGGLAFCDVCKGGEGDLPTDCPSEPMEEGTRRAVLMGLADFVNGEWVIDA